MKKRIFSAVLILIMLLAIPSCSMDQLTEFVGKMNENVMGVDPENAAKADEAIKNSTTESANSDEIKNLQDTINGIFTSGEGGGDTQIKVPGNILPSLEADAIGNLANSINKAAGAAGFGDSMEKPAANVAATKGSAELVTNIVKAGFPEQSGIKINGDGTIDLGEDFKLDNQDLQDMVSGLVDGINFIVKENSDYSPKQADAVILQMTQSVVMTIANSDAIKEAEGNLENIDPTQLITADNKKMLQSAIDTINVLAPHSAFEGLNINLDSLLDSFMNGEGASNA